MSFERTPGDVIRDLPEWRGATWTELGGGLTNRTWRLEKHGRKAVLKIDEFEREAPYNSRPAEAAVQSTAARAGLAARVLHADSQVYLAEYMEGTVWEPACLEQPANIERLAAALRRLHALPLSGRPFDAAVAAKRYVKKIENPEQEPVAECLDIVDSMQLPQNLCCCHNDLVAENIISTPALRFLDWEYACDNDPFFDLATIVEHHELSEQQSKILLDAYFDGCGERWHANLRQQRTLYLALLWLWLASRPGVPGHELQRVRERLSTSGS